MNGTGDKPVKIDESIKNEILMFPTVDLVRKLYPDAKMRGRALMCNPLRGEKHPSLSFVRDTHGISRWKDFATDEKGDNIDFFRMVHPEMDYVTAVDSLAWLLLGRSAFEDSALSSGYSESRASKAVARKSAKAPEERPPVLTILTVAPLLESDPSLMDYCNSRGISSALASRYLDSVLFRNENKAGRFLLDESGRMCVDSAGNPIKDVGESFVLGMRNDIGAWSLRGVDTPERKGFKGCDRSAVTTVLADGNRPGKTVTYVGSDNPVVGEVLYEPSEQFLYINRGVNDDGFAGVREGIAGNAVLFLQRQKGHGLFGRDLECNLGVLNALTDMKSPFACVVEGMFDALSFIRLYHPAGNAFVPGVDLVVLNSTSNYSWSVPFLAAHEEVHSFLDNDEKSRRGAQTYVRLVADLDSFCQSLGHRPLVFDDSCSIAPSKDLNEYLKGYLMQEGAGSQKSFGRHK